MDSGGGALLIFFGRGPSPEADSSAPAPRWRMHAAAGGGWLTRLAGGPTRTTRNRFELIALIAGPLVPLVWRPALRPLPTFRQIAIGNAVFIAVVLRGNISDALDQRGWVAVGSSTGDAAYRYDRLHNVLVVDLRRDWDYNSDARLDVSCGFARGDRPATGARRTVMHLDGTSIDLDDVVYCKVRDPRLGRFQLDYDGGAFLHRADA